MKSCNACGIFALVLAVSSAEPVFSTEIPSPDAVPAVKIDHRQINYSFSNAAKLPFWSAYGSSEFRGGNRRVLSDATGFVPFWQDGKSMLFADVRGQTDDRDNREGNWGMGFRSMLNDELIIGGYSFYDYRWSQTGNTFQQVTVGAEVMTYQWDMRVNGYFSDQASQAVGSNVGSNPQAIFSNNTILLVSGGAQSQALERSYSGVDFELGVLLTTLGNNNAFELRSYLGGYLFATDAEGFPNVTGPRLRLEGTVFDLPCIGPQSRLTMGAEYTWDQVRDSQVFGVVRLQVPLDIRSLRRLNPFERRMLDRVRRDVDVVTGTGFAPEVVEEALYAESGTPVGTVALVQGGDDLSQAVDNAGPGSTVIVDGSNGVVDTSSTTFMHDGQTVRGAGFEVRGAQTGLTATFGTAPVIANSNGEVDTLVVANNAVVRDLTIVGGGVGISSRSTGMAGGQLSDLHNTRVTGIQVTAAGTGMLFGNVSTGSVVSQNVVSGSTNTGFEFGDLLAGAQVDGNLTQMNGGHGFEFGNVDGGVFTNNIASMNSGDGFSFQSINQGRALIGNQSTDNAGNGFSFENVQGVFSNNTATGNGSFGVIFNDIEAVGALVDNTANGNGNGGFFFERIQRDIGLNTAGIFSGNTANGNAGTGIRVDFIGGQADFSFNTANGNGFDAENNLVDSDANGFSFIRNFGGFLNNTANGNANNGFGREHPTIGFDLDGGQFTDNTANSNGNLGFSGSLSSGDASDNTGTGNTNGGNTFP